MVMITANGSNNNNNNDNNYNESNNFNEKYDKKCHLSLREEIFGGWLLGILILLLFPPVLLHPIPPSILFNNSRGENYALLLQNCLSITGKGFKKTYKNDIWKNIYDFRNLTFVSNQ